MRKTIILLTVGLLLWLLPGCKDSDGDASEPDIPAKDPTRLTATLDGPGSAAWTVGDTLGIISVESVLNNNYVLASGAGTASGTFRRTAESGESRYGSRQLYALTPCHHLYGISATDEDSIQVVLQIPGAYKLDEVATTRGGFRLPVPWWGPASYGAEGWLTARMRPLTGLLRIDGDALPANAYAVVLATHQGMFLGSNYLTDGYNEALSGTMNAVLREGTVLRTDPHFVNQDTLRVNLGAKASTLAGQTLHIPLVCGTYHRLHVFAVTGDAYDDYDWSGKELKMYSDLTVTTDSVLHLTAAQP